MRLFSIFRVCAYRESGMTLLETVVALAILGTIAVTFLSGVTTTSKAAFTVDERATAESLAQSQMEWVQNASYNTTGYFPSTNTTSKDYINYSANITADLLSLLGGIQKITVTVKHSDKQVFTLESYKVNR